MFTSTDFQSKYEVEVYNRVVALSPELQISDLQHNIFLLDCFESDMVFTLYDNQGESSQSEHLSLLMFP